MFFFFIQIKESDFSIRSVFGFDLLPFELPSMFANFNYDTIFILDLVLIKLIIRYHDR